MVALKELIEPGGTVTLRTLAVQVPAAPASVTKRTLRTPPVTAADRLTTSSTPAAHSLKFGSRLAWRLAWPASTTYIACTRNPLAPSPSQATAGVVALLAAAIGTPRS